MVSGIFRMAVWNQTIPSSIRGRAAAIEMVSYHTGPSLGNAEAGFVAGLAGVGTSIISGGLLCVAGSFAIAKFLPKFIEYDSEKECGEQHWMRLYCSAGRRRRRSKASRRASALAGGLLMLEAVAARRIAQLTFERAIEGRFRLVSNFAGDFRYAPRRVLERPRGQLKPPASQIRHGRLGKIPGRTLHESRS